MAQPTILTCTDVIDGVNDFMTGRQSASQPMLRRAIQSAYREVAGAHNWSFLLKPGRVQLKAAQTSSTITYDHTGGTYERELTLASGTWPEAWVEDAVVRIGDAVHQIEDYKTSTVVTLDATMNPGQDVAAGTSYTLYPQWYALPADFESFMGPAGEDTWRLGQYVSPADMHNLHRYRDSTGSLKYYTVTEVPDLLGSLGLFLEPASDSTETCDYVYKRRPRELRYWGHDSASDFAGTIAVSASAKAVTGTGTAFAAAHVGSILRISSDTSKPTGREGPNPYVEERSIETWTDATHITLDANVETNRNGVKYVIADPIDLGQSAWDAFLRCCEKHLAIICNLEDQALIVGQARESLFRAKGRANTNRQRRIAGMRSAYRGRLADGPVSRDMSGY